jgi:hypothetical protein
VPVVVDVSVRLARRRHCPGARRIELQLRRRDVLDRFARAPDVELQSRSVRRRQNVLRHRGRARLPGDRHDVHASVAPARRRRSANFPRSAMVRVPPRATAVSQHRRGRTTRSLTMLGPRRVPPHDVADPAGAALVERARRR